VDDCMNRHDRALTKTDADSQFDSVVRFLTEDLGVEVKRTTDVYPSVVNDYTGIVLETARQVAYIDEKRIIKYSTKVADFLATHKAGDRVNRREFSSILGKLQWAAQVITGSQLHLTKSYWCRDMLVDLALAQSGSVKQQWGKRVEILLTDEAILDLKWWVEPLSSENATKLYLSQHPRVPIHIFRRFLLTGHDRFLEGGARGGAVIAPRADGNFRLSLPRTSTSTRTRQGRARTFR